MQNPDEKIIARQATVFLIVGFVLVILLVMDLLNRGLIWRMLNALKSENTSTLPGEKRTVGERQRTDITFIT